MSVIDETTSSTDKIPGFVCVAVNKNGDEIFSHASGKRGAGSKEHMSLDSVFWIASCTKMVGGIACMQLVEQGKLSLDDAELVGKLAPELKKAQILEGFNEKDRPIWKEKKVQITLRHLLSHTCKSHLPPNVVIDGATRTKEISCNRNSPVSSWPRLYFLQPRNQETRVPKRYRRILRAYRGYRPRIALRARL